MKKNIITIAAVALILAGVAYMVIIADQFHGTPSGENFVSQESYPSDGISLISLGVDVGYINITENKSSDRFWISTVGVYEDFYTVSVKDGTLSVTSVELNWRDREVYKTVGTYGITVSVPSSFEGRLTVRTEAGNISITGEFAEEISAATDTGEIIVDATSAPRLDISAKTGSINVNAASADKITLKTDTGSISFTEKASASALTSISAETKVGSVSLALKGSRENYSVTAKTDVGDCNVENGGDGAYVDISVGTGDIVVSFKN